MTGKPQARALAAQVLARLIDRKKSLSTLLPDYICRLPDKRDQAFLQTICYGVTRQYYFLEEILNHFLEKQLKTKDNDIKTLIMSGLYQGIFLQTPAHAMVSASVNACDELRKPWAKNLVNAILRKFIRESEYIQEEVRAHLPARYSHPPWLLELLQDEYPDSWQEICQQNNRNPPMFLRVNKRLTTVDNYLKLLIRAGIPAIATEYSDAGIRLEQPVDVYELPKFQQGFVSVQDLAAQLTPALLDLKPDLRILDACAAPGGKLAHILETEPQLPNCIAIENDASRFELLKQTLERLQLKTDINQTDIRNLDNWWDGNKFDRILLDTPCSATGVIRRHPDIKLLRTPEEINTITILQNDLLNKLWPLLNVGGKLLYVTCSILSAENDSQIKKFLKQNKNVTIIEINAEWGIKTEYGRQILPGQNDMDGFYYACLQKN